MVKDNKIKKQPNQNNDSINGIQLHESMVPKAWRRFKRHPGAIVGTVVLSIIVLSVILAPLSPYDPETSDTPSRYQPPSWEHPFGTDGIGRDLLTRVLYGGRISLFVGTMVVIITLVIGVPIGVVAGYFGGWIDNLLLTTISLSWLKS